MGRTPSRRDVAEALRTPPPEAPPIGHLAEVLATVAASSQPAGGHPVKTSRSFRVVLAGAGAALLATGSAYAISQAGGRPDPGIAPADTPSQVERTDDDRRRDADRRGDDTSHRDRDRDRHRDRDRDRDRDQHRDRDRHRGGSDDGPSEVEHEVETEHGVETESGDDHGGDRPEGVSDDSGHDVGDDHGGDRPEGASDDSGDDRGDDHGGDRDDRGDDRED